jgi:hypothetical protein
MTLWQNLRKQIFKSAWSYYIPAYWGIYNIIAQNRVDTVLLKTKYSRLILESRKSDRSELEYLSSIYFIKH